MVIKFLVLCALILTALCLASLAVFFTVRDASRASRWVKRCYLFGYLAIVLCLVIIGWR